MINNLMKIDKCYGINLFCIALGRQTLEKRIFYLNKIKEKFKQCLPAMRWRPLKIVTFPL